MRALVKKGEITISIHSPLRGETKIIQIMASDAKISIHSPLRGETTPALDT